MKNIEIDFELFCEKEVDTSKIMKLKKIDEIYTLSKCGFLLQK